MKSCKLCNLQGLMSRILSIILSLLLLMNFNTYALPDGGDDDDDDGGGNWSTKANTIHHNYSFGTKNAFPILFKTNNIQRMVLTSNGFFGINVLTPLAPLHTNGDVIFNTLIGTGIGLVYTGADGKISRYSFTGNNRHVLLGDGTFGEYSDNDWMVDGNNIYNQNTGNVGINTQTPEYQLDVNGDAKVRGEFSVGNSIKFNGITDQITTTTGNLDFGTTNLSTDGTIKTNSIISNSGTINFGNTNITTTGNISGGGVSFSGSSVFDDITVNHVTSTDKLTANAIYVKNAIRFTEASTAIASAGDLNIETQGNVKINTAGNTIINSKLGVGTDSPIEMLDVAGNANIQGYLYVQDGVIIGRRISGEKVSADTIDIAKKLTAKEIEASEKIRNSNITIDGQNSTISSQSGQIGFANTNLANINNISTNGTITSNEIITTKITSPNNTVDFADNILGHVKLLSAQKIETGDISASTINITGATTTFNNITVNNGINLGKELIFTGSESRINSPYNLLLQNEATSGNTVMNLNAGKVGIGIENPIEMLDVNGNANIRGTLYVQDGVIIGQRMEGEVIEASDVIRARELQVNDLIKTKSMQISEGLDILDEIRVPIARMQNLSIDGQNSTITSTSGIINFDDENLLTTGTVEAGTISATTITTDNLTITNPISLAELTITDKLEVTNSIKVGNNSLWLSSNTTDGTTQNSIFTDNGDLKIQCQGTLPTDTRNTIINTGNTGNVGIGTLAPMKKLHVKTSEITTAEESRGSLRLEHEIQGVTTSLWDVSPTAVTTTGNLNRLDFIADDSPMPVLSLQKDGKVGVGTTAPNEQFEVNGAIKIGTTDNVNPGTIRFKNNEFEGNTTDGWKSLTDNGVWSKIGTTNNIEYTTGHVYISPDKHISLKNGFHGLGYFDNTALGATHLFANKDIDGPVLYGYSGGALGSKTETNENVALQWLHNGDVKINSLATGADKMVVADAYGTLGVQDIATNTDASGNVGIGTSAPTKIDDDAELFAGVTPKLEILTGEGNSPYSELVTIRHNKVDSDIDNDRALGLILKMSNEEINTSQNESAKMGGIMLESKIGWSNNPSLFFLTNNKQQAELKANGDFKLLNGKMGIGTNNLIAKLNIGGSIIIEGPDLVLGTNDTRYQGTKLNNRALVHDEWPANTDKLVINYNGDFEDGVKIAGPKTIIEGNLGIGCSNPLERLTVDGKIKVKDEIIIDEVGDWSDYVFDKDYKMLSIPELENYINENKHLPNIPSAKVVETEGLHIMDMNRRMMEKIEELTLYVIEQNKAIEELKKGNNELKAKMLKLENK